jgi:hypothetical protein
LDGRKVADVVKHVLGSKTSWQLEYVFEKFDRKS